MITITAELLSGTMRASTADPLAGSAATEIAEWPPTPARLFSALVAGGGSSDSNRIGTDDSELRTLEGAQPPLIMADLPTNVRISEHNDRFVVIDDRGKGRVQEYPGRLAGTIRPGARMAPRSPFVSYVWPELELSESQVDALKKRAARVPYFGTADSPVRLTVNTETPEQGRAVWTPDPEAGFAVSVPYAGFLDELDRSYRDFKAGGAPRGGRLNRARVNYRTPDSPDDSAPQPTVFWLGFENRLSGRKVLAVATALRGAFLKHYDRLFDDVPVEIHGHDIARGAQHARFVPLANVGYSYSKGRIYGAAVWLPAGLSPEIVGRAELACLAIRDLTLPNGVHTSVALRDDRERAPWASNPRRWQMQATEFRSAFPVVHERFGKVKDPTATVQRWCRHAGVPEPQFAELSSAGFFDRQPRFAAREVWRPRSTEGYPFSHVRLLYDAPQSGLFVIGRGRSFGLGLLTPVPTQRPSTVTETEESDDA